MVEIEW